MRVGKERKRAVYPGPSNSPNGIVHVILDVRSNLVGRLADALGDDHANAIVGALDAYLEADPGDRLPAFQLLPPNPNDELDKARKERDEAVARAEEAEQKLELARAEKSEPRCASTTYDKIASANTQCVLMVGHAGKHRDGAMSWVTARAYRRASKKGIK
jgi:hypothetical protein